MNRPFLFRTATPPGDTPDRVNKTLYIKTRVVDITYIVCLEQKWASSQAECRQLGQRYDYLVHRLPHFQVGNKWKGDWDIMYYNMCRL